MVGKYVDLSDSYKSLNEALRHAGMKNHAREDRLRRLRDHHARRRRRAAGQVRRHPGARRLRQARHRRQDRTPRFARENKVPYLGICLGMQVATIEVRAPRGRPGRRQQHRVRPDTPHPVIALITEWKDADGTIQSATTISDLGGTMRLGAQSSDVPGARWPTEIYGDVVTERHRHRYEANVNYLDRCAGAAW